MKRVVTYFWVFCDRCPTQVFLRSPVTQSMVALRDKGWSMNMLSRRHLCPDCRVPQGRPVVAKPEPVRVKKTKAELYPPATPETASKLSAKLTSFFNDTNDSHDSSFRVKVPHDRGRAIHTGNRVPRRT